MRLKFPLIYIFLISLAASSYSQSLELPALEETGRIICHSGFTLHYSEEFEQADWVAYELTAQEVAGSVKRKDDFRPDPLIPTGSAELSDYRGSGYDRGHLAPAGDMKFSEQAMSDSFYLSNMSPQDPSFNRGIWKSLEEQVRTWAVKYDRIYIVSGPILNRTDLPRIGANRVAVPGYYYKVLLVYGQEKKAIGFILPNKKGEFPLPSYAVTVDDVEILTGIDFFPALPDSEEEILESSLIKEFWFSVQELRQTPSSLPLQAPLLQISDSHSDLFWINSPNHTRHNRDCRYYGNTADGYYTNEREGNPCGLCGG